MSKDNSYKILSLRFVGSISYRKFYENLADRAQNMRVPLWQAVLPETVACLLFVGRGQFLVGSVFCVSCFLTVLIHNEYEDVLKERGVV